MAAAQDDTRGAQPIAADAARVNSPDSKLVADAVRPFSAATGQTISEVFTETENTVRQKTMSQTFKHVVIALLVILGFVAALIGLALGGGGHGLLYESVAWLDITFVITALGAINPILVVAAGIGYHFGYSYLVRAGTWPISFFLGLRTVGLVLGLCSLADKPSGNLSYFHWLPLGLWIIVNGGLITLHVVHHRTGPNRYLTATE